LHRSGERSPRRLAGWKSWLWLIRHVSGLFSASRRSSWMWVAGNRVGHLLGSIRSRSLHV
jgi:hypothetical protein